MKPLPVEGHVTPELLAPLAGKQVLITGAKGFVGRWMHESLEASGVECICWGVGRREPYPVLAYDYVLHCATDGDDLDRAMSMLASGGKMLYLSSGAVYNSRNCPTELHGVYPTDEYAAKKLRHEEQCKDVAVIARMFTFIGPGLRRHTGAEFLTANPIVCKCDFATRSYMYAGDMARWLWTVLLNGRVGEAYNVGSNLPMSVLGFARLCGQIRRVDVELDTDLAQVGNEYVPSISKATEELGLKCRISVGDAIRRTLEWQAK